MQARIITDRQQWNDFVAASVCCNITQSYEWGELESLSGAQAMHVGVIDDAGQLCAAMLMQVTRAPLLRRNYFYAPRGPVIDDPASPALPVLLDYVRVVARKCGMFMLKVEPSVADGNAAWLMALRKSGFRPNPHANHVRHEWILDLRPDEQDILAGMKEKWRYNIRLATRKGVTIRRGTQQADIDAFYRIYETTSERDQFFIHDKHHYEDIMRLFSMDETGTASNENARAEMLLAEYEGQAIAGIIVLRLGRWSWYMFGASSNEHRNLMPNHLLQWHGIQWARAQGCWYYNFRGIPDVLEEGRELYGVYVFKRGFGGYPMRFLETHDLVYSPLVYGAYTRLREVKLKRDEKERRRIEEQRRQGSEANRV